MTKFPDWEFQAELSFLSADEFSFSHHGVNSSNLLGRSSPSSCSQRHSAILGYLVVTFPPCHSWGRVRLPQKRGSGGHLKTNMLESGTRKFSLLPEFTLNLFKQHMTISWYKCITGNWVEDKNKWDSGVELPLVWEAWSFPGEISYFQAVLPWWRRDLASEYSGLLHPHWANLSLNQK